jgi:hypothetical protein
MANNLQQFLATNVIANATTSGNTELAVATLTGITPVQAGASALIQGYISFTTGANITSARIRIRQGTGITGTVVGDTGVDPSGVGASAIATKNVDGVDTGLPLEVAAAYTMTLTTAGGTPGNTTIQFAVMSAYVFS